MSSSNPGLSTKQAASIMDVSPNTLRSWDRRFGFPPYERTAGGHRRYERADINPLARLLRQGLPISKAIEHIQKTVDEIPKKKLELPSALENYDITTAKELMEEVLAVRSIERAVQDVLLPSVRVIGQAHDLQSAAWDFATGWAVDWMKQDENFPTDAHKGNLVVGDANNGIMNSDGFETAAFEFFAKRLGFEVLNFAVEHSDDIGSAVNRITPEHIVLAGSSSSYRDTDNWVDTIRAETDYDTISLFRSSVKSGPVQTLPNTPHQASSALLAP